MQVGQTIEHMVLGTGTVVAESPHEAGAFAVDFAGHSVTIYEDSPHIEHD